MSTDQPKATPCGHFVPTIEGQLAFVPDPPPSYIDLTPSLVSQLEKALLAVGTLAGVGETLPNPNLLIVPFLHREAVLSSRIEGTQASISDLFVFEASGERIRASDAREVVNYVHALNLGLDLLSELPICLRLVNSIHARLLQDVRGE
ncbi:MAG: Fic family protein, partial [Dehalococcoidia bacterium]|nr:Fic family protein [Dehalococcoidia bacterium]